MAHAASHHQVTDQQAHVWAQVGGGPTREVAATGRLPAAIAEATFDDVLGNDQLGLVTRGNIPQRECPLRNGREW